MDNQTTNTQTIGGLPFNSPSEEVIIGVDIAKEANYASQAKAGEITPLYSHEKLLSGLYFIFDAFERCGIDFFLVKQTAKDAISSHQLTGNTVDIGVRSLEWANDSKDMLFPYLEQEHVEITKQEPAILACMWQAIPFTIHLYTDNPCITALIPLVYENEHFKIPNRFDIFEKEYDR